VSALSIERGQRALDAGAPYLEKLKLSTPQTDDTQENEVYGNLAPPEPTDDMFYGIAGDVGRAAASGTEVNPVAAQLFYMTMLSAAFGRDPYLSVGNTFHHCRIFAGHVGRTGRGRKGDAQGAGKRIRQDIRDHFSELGHFHSGGLSSREGLAAAIQDPDGEGEGGTADKRLFVIESEFVNVLAQSRREGNTLSAALRDAWDGSDIKPLVKHSPTHCSAPHIAIWANITPREMQRMMTEGDVSNGFLNRFLFVWAERTGLVAIPTRMDEVVVRDFADRTLEIVQFARGAYPASQNTRRMTLSSDAATLYQRHYRDLCEPDAPELVATLVERAAPYVLRLAMLFALTDKSLVIETKHLTAALAWVAYCCESVAYIFTRDEAATEHRRIRDDAAMLVKYLSARTGKSATRTQISVDCFQKHRTRARLDELLKSLAADRKIVISEKADEGKKPTQIVTLGG